MTPSEWLLRRFDTLYAIRSEKKVALYTPQLMNALYARPMLSLIEGSNSPATYTWKPGTPHPQLPEVVH
jgi:hypothetical protein